MAKTIGVVGLGYVGTAVLRGMERTFIIETYDKFRDSTCKDIRELCKKAKIIFICVPTPMKSDGSCDIGIVESVVREIDSVSNEHIIVIKSTVPPTTTEVLNKRYSNVSIVFSPEFLTEANYIDDFINSNRIIIGGPRKTTTIIKNVFLKRFPKKKIIKTGSSYAEMVKYLTNTFLATKVSFANEMKQICDHMGVDYDKVVEYSRYDDRLGQTHWSVPGPDGKEGFGGSCFPKDINALISFCRDSGIDAEMLEAAWGKNLKVRPERDWESLVGRAVTIKGDE
jgi:nucleotide sugar dehydrogenase